MSRPEVAREARRLPVEERLSLHVSWFPSAADSHDRRSEWWSPVPELTVAVVAPPDKERDHKSSLEEKSRRSRQSETAEVRRRSPPSVPENVETILLTCWIWFKVEWSMERKPVDMPLAGAGKVDFMGGDRRMGIDKEECGRTKERDGEKRMRNVINGVNIDEAMARDR